MSNNYNLQLQSNNTDLQAILNTINELPEAGIELPTLTNKGSASDLLSGKQLIDQGGNVITGTFSIDSELTTQDTLIAELQSVLDGKAGGSESSFETVIGTVGASGPVIGDTVTGTVYYIDGNGAYATSNILGTITVMKDSIIVGYSGDGVRASGGVNQIGERTGIAKTYHVIDDFEIRI